MKTNFYWSPGNSAPHQSVQGTPIGQWRHSLNPSSFSQDFSTVHLRVAPPRLNLSAPATPVLLRSPYPEEEDLSVLSLEGEHHGKDDEPGTILESEARLSHSLMWTWLRNFYDQHGNGVWSSGLVASLMSSNGAVARMYAALLVAMLKDILAPTNKELKVDPSKPIYIVEVGAGSGKLAHLIVNILLGLLPYFRSAGGAGGGGGGEGGGGCPFVYVVTDSCDEVVAHYRSHPSLKPLIEMGVVECAVFDCMEDVDILLESDNIEDNASVSRSHSSSSSYIHSTNNNGGAPSSSSSSSTSSSSSSSSSSQHKFKSLRAINRNPIIFIGNYVLSSLPQDAFVTGLQGLKESLLSLVSYRPFEVDMEDPGLITRTSLRWTHRDIGDGGDYYSGSWADLNPILKDYQGDGSGSSGSLLMPVGSLAFFRNWSKITDNRMFCLFGDKGYRDPREWSGLTEPHVAVHNCFSLMANFDAVDHWVRRKSGFSLITPHLEGFKVGFFGLGAAPSSFTNTRLCFEWELCEFGPESFFSLQKATLDDAPHPSIKHLLALIRLSGYDPDVFHKCKKLLIEQVMSPFRPWWVVFDVRHDMEKLLQHAFPLTSDRDLSFDVARVFMALGEHARALQVFEQSEAHFGRHHVTYYNKALCHIRLTDLLAAQQCLQASISLKPDYREAIDCLEDLNARKSPL